MDIVDLLVGEHGVLNAQLEYLERDASRAASLPAVQAQVSVLAVGLQSHAQVEDDILFTALEPHLGASSPVLVGMRMMHEDIDRTLERLAGAGELTQAREELLGLIGLVRQHFLGEEQAVFPLARQVVDEGTLRRLAVEWAERRGILQSGGP